MGSLEKLLKEADVVTLHVPLLNSTRDLIGKKELDIMKKSAILVNCARGGVVNEQALLVALQAKSIWGAALDAVEIEPPTVESHGEFLKLENVIVTPHIGASTMESRSGTFVVKTLLSVLAGKETVGKLV